VPFLIDVMNKRSSFFCLQLFSRQILFSRFSRLKSLGENCLKMKRRSSAIDIKINEAKSRLLSPEKELRLLQDIKDGDKRAIDRLLAGYDYVILKHIKELGFDGTNLSAQIHFVKSALRRLAQMDRKNGDVGFVEWSNWWIVEALRDYNSKH